MNDLDFVSGGFFELEIPKERRYLLKYFTGDLQMAFLRYYLVAGECKNFNDHTGYCCAKSLVKRFEDRFNKLVELHENSKKSFTEEGLQSIQMIESGKLKFKQLKDS